MTKKSAHLESGNLSWPKVAANQAGSHLDSHSDSYSYSYSYSYSDPHSQSESDLSAKNLDSGRAWLILLALFLMNSSVNGSTRLYGLVYAKQVETNYYDRQEASWPSSLASCVENCFALLTPALLHFISWRQLELLSTSLFVASSLLAYFSSSLALDMLCLGFIQGLGLSINTVLALAVNNDYFERYRTSAYGIALSGSTFGILYLAPCAAWILEMQSNFRLVYLALACLFLLNYPLALLVKPRSTSSNKRRAASSSREEPSRQTTRADVAMPSNKQRKISTRIADHFERQNSAVSIGVQCAERRISAWSRVSAGSNCDPAPLTLNIDDRLPKSSNASEPAEPQVAPAGGSQVRTRLAADAKRLAADPAFHLVWLMLALYSLVSRAFILILVDFGHDRGLQRDESRRLLNYWSAGELCGRILLASFVDLRWLSAKSCILLTCLSLSASVLLMVLAAASYLVFALCSALVAAFVSLEYVLINVFIVEHFGEPKVTSCFALASLLSSLVLFARPFLIGLFRDQFGSYDGLLLLCAGLSLFVALLVGLLKPASGRKSTDPSSHQQQQTSMPDLVSNCQAALSANRSANR